MYTIIVNHQHELVATHTESIMQRSKMINKLRFLVDAHFDCFDMSEFTVYMEYKLPVSEQYCSEILEPSEKLYKDIFLEYILPFDTNLTAEAGDVEVQLTFVQVIVNEDGTNEQIVRKTNTISITILPIAAWSDIIPDGALTAIDQRIIKLEAMLEALEQYDGDTDSENPDTETEPGPDEDEPEPEDETIAYAYSLDDILEAIENDDIETIILEEDIVSDSPGGIWIDNGVTKTVDLNGHSVTALCDYVDSNSAAFYVVNGTLTIDGDGDVDGGGGCPSDVAVWAYSENSKVIINGGSYTVHKDKDGAGNSTIYAESGAEIIINDGHFDNDANSETIGAKRYVLNIQNNTGSVITCYGGEYVGQNPADGDDKDTTTGTTFLGEGCTVIEDEVDGIPVYTVYKNE